MPVIVAQSLYSQDRGVADGGAVSGLPESYFDWAVPIDPSVHSAPLAVCFDAANPPNPLFVEQMMQVLGDAGLLLPPGDDFSQDYNLGPKWSGGQGNPRALTWSFVPDGLSIPNGIGEGTAPSNLFSSMNSKFASQGGQATWILRFEQSFARWSQIAGLSYTRIKFNNNEWDDGASWGSSGGTNRGDIRICSKLLDGNGGVLAYNSFPSDGDMVIDSGDAWGQSTNQHRFLRNVIMHEHGHGIGLAHTCSSNSNILMEPSINTSYDGPRHDDVRGAQRHYGDPFESDNSAAAARDIGQLVMNTTVTNLCTMPGPQTGTNPANTTICSIDANGKTDFLRFSLGQSAKVTVTVTPVGQSYDSSSQAGNGSCNCCNVISSSSMANLAVDVRASNGTTILATAAGAGIGLPETISELGLEPGTYYIRVYESDSPTQSQLYNITVGAAPSVVEPPCDGDVNGDKIVDQSDLGILLGNFNLPVDPPGCCGDLDGSGFVTQSDLGILLAAFGNNCN